MLGRGTMGDNTPKHISLYNYFSSQPTVNNHQPKEQNPKDYTKIKTLRDLGAFEHNKYLLMNLQVRIHVLFPNQHQDMAEVFDFGSFALQLGL